jgi:uncharacterized membrane protein YkvA (DUF1232 family)
MEQKPSNSMVPSRNGMLHEVTLRAKLFFRLFADDRVSWWAKLIPMGALAYLISPVDLISVIPGVSALDDVAILWMGYYTFIEMCPPEVVGEILKQLGSNNAMVDKTQPDDDVVDGEVVDVTDEQ